MQNGYVHDQGFLARLGADITATQAIVEPIARLVVLARAVGMPVIFARYCLAPDYADAGRVVQLFPGMRDARALVRGTWDCEVVDELRPARGDVVIDKTRYSAFWATELKERLDCLGVDELVLCGVATNFCVEGTARDAFSHDYRVVVVADATAASTPAMHDAALATIGLGIGEVLTVGELEERVYAGSARDA